MNRLPTNVSPESCLPREFASEPRQPEGGADDERRCGRVAHDRRAQAHLGILQFLGNLARLPRQPLPFVREDHAHGHEVQRDDDRRVEADPSERGHVGPAYDTQAYDANE